MPDLQPVFLFSLPRSGSTLLQRLLGAHPHIATVSEPWVLLPMCYSMRPSGLFSEYNHQFYYRAWKDFVRQLPEGEKGYREALRAFALDLYGRVSPPGTRYFLDKTPRYHLIAGDVMRLFPEGKFIFLWRNPLAVTASIMNTWAEGRWNLHVFRIDLFKGLATLAETASKAGDRAFFLRYEDLVSHPEEQMTALCRYLDVSFDPALLQDFSGVRLTGRMGDRWGTAEYQEVSARSLDRWQQQGMNPLRRAWMRRYVRWIGADRLAVMGYDERELMRQLDATPRTMRRLGSDLVRMGRHVLQPWVEPHIVRDKWRRRRQPAEVVAHA
ncbi:sulfotransferase family protein [Rhodocaloribacter sp.]